MQSFSSSGTATATTKQSNGAPQKKIWTSLLESVSSGKRLAEKQLLLLGGTPESQREFLTSLATVSKLPNSKAYKPPIANQFALGYTYQDVLEEDQDGTTDDILARLSVYTLSKPSSRFIPLLRPLFTPETIPNMLLVILFDWSDPWNWIQELRAWVRMLRSLLVSLPDETKMGLEDNIHEWRDRKRRDANESSSSGGDVGTSSVDADITLPLGPGEWDSPLGVPLCVVCQNANKIEILEKESGWKDKHFDFVQQFVRTVLLKHGGSLIYTMPHMAGSENALQTLIHSSLGVQNLLQKKTLKHNTTDRDHILVPPNFDSWGKIRILTEDFNCEQVSQAWDQELEAEPSEVKKDGAADEKELSGDAVLMYGGVIKNPKRDLDTSGLSQKNKSGIEVESRETQSFLGEQAEILDELARVEELAKKDEKNHLLRDTKKNAGILNTGEVEEHIGPVQFNLGGIQMDAEDMVKRLKDREANRGTESENPKTPTFKSKTDNDEQNEKLASFFAGLIKKPGGSASNSPRRAADGH